MIEQTYKLSMIPFEEQVRRNYEIPIVPASQYDKTLRTLSFELYNGEDRFIIPAEAVVYIFGMKPDGNAFQYQMTVEDNMAKIAMQTQMTTVAGCVTCEIVLFEENTAGPRIGSANFKLMVEKCAVGDDAEFSRSDMPVIQTLIFGGMVGDVLVKDANGVKWNSESLSTGYMRYDQYDQDRTGTVNSARQANNAATVDGHTVARNVLADEYTNEQIDESFESVREEISDLDSVAVKSVNSIQPDQNGNVQLSKADIGLGNVDNTADIDKPISSAAQEALDQKVDKVPGMGLSQNSFTDTEKEKLEGIEAGAEVNVQANWDQTVPTADDYIQNKPSIPENTSDLVNDSGFITAALAPVQGVKGSAESAYRTGNVSISKANIGLGNVDNTSDVNKPISTATQSALDQKVDKVSGKGLSTNDFTNAEKTKLAGIEAGAQVNTITGVKGNAEAAYRTGNVNITKANIGLGNVNNTSDLDKPISTATQAALDLKQNTLTFDSTPTAGSTNPVTSDGIASVVSTLNSNLSQKVSSVNDIQPDTNGNVSLNAEDIPADGVGSKDVSGNPIIITDGVADNAQNLSVDFDPIQDLHGYDHPWAGGAGKNLLPMTVDGIKAANTIGSWSGNVYTISGITFTILTDDAGNVTGININRTTTGGSNSFNIFSGSINVPSNCKVNLNASANDENCDFTVRNESTTIAQIIGRNFKTADGTLAGTTITRIHMYFNANFSPSESITVYPMIRLASETDATFEPYSNICPISGRTGTEVQRTGKNLLPMTVDGIKALNTSGMWSGNAYTFQGITYTVNTDSSGNVTTIVANGTSTGNADLVLDRNNQLHYPAGILNGAPSSSCDLRIEQVDSPWRTIARDTGSGASFNEFTEKAAIFARVANGVTVSNVVLKPMIRKASIQDATFEPYHAPDSASVTFGQTVYGGQVDFKTGKVRVTLANIASYNGETIGEPWWSSMDEYVEGATPTTGAQVVYTLETPTTVSLTPAQLALLEGYNILTTDGDNINLRYTGTVASNVQSEIDEFEESTRKLAGSLAMVETSPAMANHAVGSYLMLNNRLCKVTAAIATGEQIILGSNVQYTTIAEELVAILAQINA